MDIDQKAIAYVIQNLNLSPLNVQKVIQLLLVDDCTIPFISRYRKEATGGMDEVQVAAIQKTYNDYIERENRRKFILDTINAMEKLTPELEKKIIAAETLNQLEDLYSPYKSKRKTKGQLAIEAGIAPLAEVLKTTADSLEKVTQNEAIKFINSDLKFENVEDVLEGAKAIISEEIVHNTEIKEILRKDFWQTAILKSEKKKDADNIKDSHKFKDYFEFEQKVSELRNAKAGHRFLAMRRGLTLKVLSVKVEYDEERALATLAKNSFQLEGLGCRDFLEKCVKRAYSVYIYPSLDTEIKSELKIFSDESAIDVFGINLKNLLLQPYLGQKPVVGIDPGIRTGCKLAVIDKNGNFLVDTVIYPHEPRNDIKGTKDVIEKCIEQFGIKHIAIGNGTFGRETLEVIRENVESIGKGQVKAMLVNEDGASIYSASDIARKEFPEKDLTVRGAISIARRFQDPLGELVKIDPKSIGVGQYQHDVNQAKLKKNLSAVVENCVNFVGVDINTASAPLLSYISGIGPTLASNIVKFRGKNQGFKTREELLKVGRFSSKVFEQSAGFLRIYDAENPLDGTFIHPERYEILRKWCIEQSITIDELIGNKENVERLKNDKNFEEEVGHFTRDDIVKSLMAPSQDPRTEFVSFEYREDAKNLKDIKVGQYYPGIVTNITQFGAFVDIGIKENGLIHVSQIADKFVDNALEVLKVGQEVKARVMDVDFDRKRISLSLKSEESNRQRPTGQKPIKQNSSRPKNPNRPNKPAKPKQPELRNNAFAGLKNLKFKI